MAAMDFELIPISKDSQAWQCCILKCGGLTVLLNCGWTESLDSKLFTPLLPHLSSLDLILLTHADLKHIGALPYLLSKCDVACPVLCTEPVNRIGELICVACAEDREKYQAASEDFDVEDVLRIFMSNLTPMKFHESFTAQGKGGRSLTVCPYPAGGQLGSTYWTIHCGSFSAVYLVDFDLRKGRYLDGLEIQQLLSSHQGAAQRWDLVITSLPPAINSQLPRHGAQNVPDRKLAATSKALNVARGVAEQHLLEESISTLRKGGTVLIPSDAVSEVPELLLLFEAAWKQDRQLATNYPLVWLSSVGDMVLDQLKTRLEFMSREVLKTFETQLGQNPFVLKFFKVFSSLEELCATHPLQRPKVIITTSPHLEGGDSRELFMRLCPDPANLLWISGVPPRETLARQLLDDFVLKHGTRKDYRIKQYSKQPLPDEHLKAYYEAKMDELAESGLTTLLPEVEPKMDTPATRLKVKAEMFDFEDKLDEKKEEPLKDEKEFKKDEKQDKLQKPTLKEVKKEKTSLREVKEELKAQASKQMPVSRDDSKLRDKLLAKEASKAALGGLWTPFGWPMSRTISHWDGRHEGDDYGHLLLASELKAWKSQDQEETKYSFGFIDLNEGAAQQPKQEFSKVEGKAEDDAKVEVVEANWKEQMSMQFSEPMRCEVRDRMVRVACRVRLLPRASQDPKDILTLLQMMSPKHIALMPIAGEAVPEAALMRHFRFCNNLEGSSLPDIHGLEAAKPSGKFQVQGVKRKFQFEATTWKKLSFMKASDGVRVASVRVAQAPGADPRGVPELKSCEAPTGMLALGDGNDSNVTNASDGALSATDRLPRGGALFLGLGQQRNATNLSHLRDQIVGAESNSDMDFRAPPASTRRPWSSRVLVAEGGKAVVGWVDPQQKHGSDEQPTTGKSNKVIRVEGVPCEAFFRARAALYNKCLLV